ncbi:TROVE domain-containing protein [Actinokineospora enzanensis]|uniref:TROVE domain-containing protein n=1 Tax=Actinokineospora enzanensis TaxID=155975 RepID=UPI00037C5369|nr:TROVE domain-containing protein [Actinokineospora enzanensis]
MSKFNKVGVRPAVRSPVVTTDREPNHAGRPGHARDLRGELFLLAVSNMAGERTFHESAGSRDERYAELVRAATVADPDWTARLLRWLRAEASLRSASLVGAAEFAKARLDAGLPGRSRQVIDSVLLRADEPGELLAYWISTCGRAVPKPVKRGIADAAARLYDERALLKWDGDSHAFRFADVLDLAHPSPRAPWQGELFRHALDLRHDNADGVPAGLPVLTARAALMAVPVAERAELFARDDAVETLRSAGMTWESVAGWLQGPLTARVWESLIPSMGYMALLRNLRNFDAAEVSDEAAARVAARLADPAEVARSRQLPMRFLSAYRAASARWAYPLERALESALANVPALPGRTLVLVDRSGSMFWSRTSGRSELTWADTGALFGSALALRAAHADLVEFGSTSQPVHLRPRESLLRAVDGRFHDLGGTDTPSAIREHYRGHDRVVIVTDEQYTNGYDPTLLVPADIPVYTWNLVGYGVGHAQSGMDNRHTFGGLSDAAFRAIPLLESGRTADWPF